MGAKPKSVPVLQRKPLAVGTHYFPIPCFDAETVSFHLMWDDTIATTSVDFETTDSPDVAFDSTEARDWQTETSPSITGPASAATEGNERHSVTGLGARRARLKVVVSTEGEFEIWTHGKD